MYNNISKAIKLFHKAAPAVLLAVLSLSLSGCVVADEEYEAARRQRDEYRSQLQEIHLRNDLLNQDISKIYADCQELSGQLAVIAAANAHTEYTTDLLSAPARPRTTRPRGVN